MHEVMDMHFPGYQKALQEDLGNRRWDPKWACS